MKIWCPGTESAHALSERSGRRTRSGGERGRGAGIKGRREGRGETWNLLMYVCACATQMRAHAHTHAFIHAHTHVHTHQDECRVTGRKRIHGSSIR